MQLLGSHRHMHSNYSPIQLIEPSINKVVYLMIQAARLTCSLPSWSALCRKQFDSRPGTASHLCYAVNKGEPGGPEDAREVLYPQQQQYTLYRHGDGQEAGLNPCASQVAHGNDYLQAGSSRLHRWPRTPTHGDHAGLA